MARFRHTVRTGSLHTTSEAIASVRAPRLVVDGVRRRREDAAWAWPVAPRLAHHA